MSIVAEEPRAHAAKTCALLIEDETLVETVLEAAEFTITGECLHNQDGEVLALLDRGQQWFTPAGMQLLCIQFPLARRLQIRSKIATFEYPIVAPLRLSGGMLWATWPICFFSGGRWYSYSSSDTLCRAVSIR